MLSNDGGSKARAVAYQAFMWALEACIWSDDGGEGRNCCLGAFLRFSALVKRGDTCGAINVFFIFYSVLEAGMCNKH